MMEAPPFDEEGGITRETWAEHQRRQRSIRMLMMFLMMLILMEGDEAPNRKKSLRGRRKVKQDKAINIDLWEERRRVDGLIGGVIQRGHERYIRLIGLNDGVDVEMDSRKWAADHLVTDDGEDSQNGDGTGKEEKFDSAASKNVRQAKEAFKNFEEEEKMVWTYPRNATGTYRGEWKRMTDFETIPTSVPVPVIEDDTDKGMEKNHTILSDEKLTNLLPQQSYIGMHLMPSLTQLDMKQHQNYSTISGRKKHEISCITTQSLDIDQPLEFTKEEGSTIIRLYSRPIAGMQEVSLLDGVVHLYDVNDRGFTSHMKHLTLRVRGVIIHSIGKISLVGNDGPWRSAFVVKGLESDPSQDQDQDRHSRRTLLEAGEVDENKDDDGEGEDEDDKDDETIENNEINVEKIRDEALQRYGEYFNEDVGGEKWKKEIETQGADEVVPTRSTEESEAGVSKRRMETKDPKTKMNHYVGPNPFLPDDDKGTLCETPPNVEKAVKIASSSLIQNGRDCEFELDFNMTETQWTVGEWRTMLRRLAIDMRESDPNSHNDNSSAKETVKNQRDEAVVMNMIGTIRSPECNFISSLNVTAVRTDWEQTTAKAINYCFFMMVACLAQTVFLLRQLIHSQPQSAAVRVSLISVGWQTVLDAILCIEHILLCLLLQPVSTAFAMVAFLKLLIFCVIEMKYMVIIMQARLNAAGNNLSTTDLRRRITGLHFRFYFAVMAALCILWNFREKHRTLCILAMYGFWVPQIIQNIVTETKRPLHDNYIYGMSATRLIAPIYTLAVPNNFFKEIEPEFPVDYFSCQMLLLWLGFQTAILIGQSKYGARFMIPARFLPPKFDYSRPIPDHMLPRKPTTADLPPLNDDSEAAILLENDVMNGTDMGPRNRKEKRSRNGTDESNGITTINHSAASQRPTLDCVICYNEIDLGDREGYMLAPCNHLFHRQCLTQWMDVKMECPVCRTELPAL